ncbi:hypothetical protein MTBBW1_1720011 [Desulfamplus magnetovallimortis]|uniref:Uncharacterized protein n=1 Tax=Desulfamplus magnetovallimortis TaxID=1246637 RepID=A0A1W1H9Q5_9BACT|nr:hypothetical protein MTBBW1_1720011 [Desulfamplus magnetovallimortis]
MFWSAEPVESRNMEANSAIKVFAASNIGILRYHFNVLTGIDIMGSESLSVRIMDFILSPLVTLLLLGSVM